MRFDIITIFPNFFDSFLSESLIAKAQKKKIIDIRVHNLRDWTKDKPRRKVGIPTSLSRFFIGASGHHTVDDRPYGGGPGMILKFEPIYRALKAILPKHPKLNPLTSILSPKGRGKGEGQSKIIMLDPAGKQFDQRMAEKFSKLDRVVLLCGRYEGFDHRVTTLVDERVSIGPYVLNGGEVPAMVIMEAVSRLIQGFVHKPESLDEETFNSLQSTAHSSQQKQRTVSRKLSTVGQYVEYPQYTRPEIVSWSNKKLSVPKILLSGDHKKIKEWQKKHVK